MPLRHVCVMVWLKAKSPVRCSCSETSTIRGLSLDGQCHLPGKWLGDSREKEISLRKTEGKIFF